MSLVPDEHAAQPDNNQIKRDDALVAAEHIPVMVEYIVEEFEPQKIILFGSHARGDATRWSDIDLLVVFDAPINKRETAVSTRMALRHFLVAKDVVVTNNEELARRGDRIGTVFRPALREGKVLYERP